MTDPIQLANQRFAQGLNCSQAVFSAFASRSGLSDEIALRIASPLGAGVARQGQVCGALTGALMALGIARGSATPEKKEETYRIAEELVARFKELHGTILCHELIGYEISTKEGLQAARENKAFASICPKLVEDAARLAAEFLAE
ncbi:MAG: C-GCAxxG-C-C family protein [Chloroflexota bacterium]